MSVTVLLSLRPAQSFCRRSLHSTASRHRWRKLLIQSFTAFSTSSDFRPRKLFAGLKTSSSFKNEDKKLRLRLRSAKGSGLNRNIFENAVAPLEKRANLCVPAEKS